MIHCPCHSNLLYQECCQPYHQACKHPKPVELMRARYSAYALNLADFIIETTHPEHESYCIDKKSWKQQIQEFSQNFEFRDLKILSYEVNQDQALVLFCAYLFQKEIDCSFTEKSLFEPIEGIWLYKHGLILNRR